MPIVTFLFIAIALLCTTVALRIRTLQRFRPSKRIVASPSRHGALPISAHALPCFPPLLLSNALLRLVGSMLSRSLSDQSKAFAILGFAIAEHVKAKLSLINSVPLRYKAGQNLRRSKQFLGYSVLNIAKANPIIAPACRRKTMPMPFITMLCRCLTKQSHCFPVPCRC